MCILDKILVLLFENDLGSYSAQKNNHTVPLENNNRNRDYKVFSLCMLVFPMFKIFVLCFTIDAQHQEIGCRRYCLCWRRLPHRDTSGSDPTV